MAHPVAKVAVRYRVPAPVYPPAVEGVFTFHAQKLPSAEPWSGDDRALLAGRVYQWWADTDPPDDAPFAPLAALYPSNMELVDISVGNVAPAVEAMDVFPVDEGAQGTSGATEMHFPQVALGIGLRTDDDTRRGRGRIYLPYAAQIGPMLYGFVFEELRIRLGELGALLASRIRGPDVEDLTMFLAVYSRVNGDSSAVLNFAIPDRVLTQRRRVPRPLQYEAYGLDGAAIT